MLTFIKKTRELLRKPIISFIVYPLLIRWLLFYAFPAALDGSITQGAIVFTLCLLAFIVFTLKIIIIPVSGLAYIESQIVRFIRNRKLNYTPIIRAFA